MAAVERRIDPDYDAAYTLQELLRYYAGTFTKKEIQRYWDESCTPEKSSKGKGKSKTKTEQKGKGKAKPEFRPKVKAEAEATSEEKAQKPRKPAGIEETVERVRACKVVPVIKLEDASHAAPLAKALKEGGIDVVEITFRTACAVEAISEVCKQVDGVCVGAGTVLSPEQVDEAIRAGADFIVSPGFDPAVAQRCRKRDVLYLPGVVTPTEVMMVSSRFKLKNLKFFPASNYGGPGTLKSFSAVFPSISFMPTGGVTEANIGDYVSLPNVFAAGGSWMVSEAAIKKAAEAGSWSDITEGARSAASKAREGAAKK